MTRHTTHAQRSLSSSCLKLLPSTLNTIIHKLAVRETRGRHKSNDRATHDDDDNTAAGTTNAPPHWISNSSRERRTRIRSIVKNNNNNDSMTMTTTFTPKRTTRPTTTLVWWYCFLLLLVGASWSRTTVTSATTTTTSTTTPNRLARTAFVVSQRTTTRRRRTSPTQTNGVWLFQSSKDDDDNDSLSRPPPVSSLITPQSSTRSRAQPPQSQSLQPPNLPAEFDYQELRAQVQALARAGWSTFATAQSLSSDRHAELQGYLQTILQQRPSPVPLTDLESHLQNTSWRLSYSTPAFAASSGLPRDATVSVEFGGNSLDDTATYRLDFTNNALLQNLVATCTWSVGTDPTATDATYAGVVTLTYQRIATSVLGFQNVGIGTFGLLQGQQTYIQTVYCDDALWMEVGTTPQGESYTNVYTRVVEEDDQS